MDERFQLTDPLTGDRLTLLADERGRAHLRVLVDGAPAATLVIVRREDVELLAHELLAVARGELPKALRVPCKVTT